MMACAVADGEVETDGRHDKIGIPCRSGVRAGAAGCERRDIGEDVVRGDDTGRGRRGVPCVFDVPVGAAVCDGGWEHEGVGGNDAGRREKLLLQLLRAGAGFVSCWDME